MPESEEPPDWGFLCFVVALLQLIADVASSGHL